MNCKNCKMTDEYCASGDCPNDTLTEQWKKGELPEGFYYVNDGAEVTIDYYLCDYWERHLDSHIYKVLARVPSYDEWQQLENWARFTDDYHALKEKLEIAEYENAELKETNEALEAELKEVCDVLIRKCPEMKEWVMLNWKNLYEVQDEEKA